MSNRITAYISKQGVRYNATEYINHGYSGVHRGRKDLPTDGYPYKVEWLWNNHDMSLIRRPDGEIRFIDNEPFPENADRTRASDTEGPSEARSSSERSEENGTPE